MKCPRCQSKVETRSTGGVEIDECSSCQGIWLTADELRRLKDETDKDLAWMDFELWKHPERFRVDSKRIQCSTCTTALVAIDYDDTGVEVDFSMAMSGVPQWARATWARTSARSSNTGTKTTSW